MNETNPNPPPDQGVDMLVDDGSGQRIPRQVLFTQENPLKLSLAKSKSSKEKANWNQKENGWHQDQASPASRRIPSGYMLIDNTVSIEPGNGLALDLTLASDYISGLVFNYQDENNFDLFFVNSMGPSTSYYRIALGQYKNGKYKEFHNLKERGEPPERLELVLEPKQEAILFKVQDKEVFLSEGHSITPESHAGFYTQQSSDAIFHSLSLFPVSEMGGLEPSVPSAEQDIASQPTSAMPEEPMGAPPEAPSEALPDIPPAPSTPEEEVDPRSAAELEKYVFEDNENEGIQPYIKIKEPFSKKEVVFQEVFEVYMDDFYESIFFNPAYNGELSDYFDWLNDSLDDKPLEIQAVTQFQASKQKQPCISAISRDGKKAYVASYDSSLSIWDMLSESGQEVRPEKGVSIEAHNTQVIRSLGLSYASLSDGQPQEIITAGEDGKVCIWHGQTLVKRLEIDADEVHFVCFSPDGTEFLAAGRGASLYHAKTGELIKVFGDKRYNSYCGAFSHDGGQVVVSGNENLYLYSKQGDGNKEIMKFTGHKRDVRCVRFSADDSSLISGGYDKAVCVWETDKPQPAFYLMGHRQWVTDVRLILEEKKLVSVSTGGEVKIWSMKNEDLLHEFPRQESGIVQAGFSEVSKQLIFSNNRGMVDLYSINEIGPNTQGASQADSVEYQNTSFPVALDTRPRLWYRMYQTIRLYEKELNVKINKLLGDNRQVKETDYPKYRELLGKRYDVRDVKGAILNDLRLNGYSLKDDDATGTDVNLKDLGYDFSITQGMPSLRSFKPFQIDLKASRKSGRWFSPVLENDIEWASLVNEFSKYLLGSGALNKIKAQAFREEMLQLQSLNTCQSLKGEIKKLEAKIAKLEPSLAHRTRADQERHAYLEQEIAAWEADIEDLEDRVKLLDISGPDHFRGKNGGETIKKVLKDKAYKKLKLDLDTVNVTTVKTVKERRTYYYGNYWFGWWGWSTRVVTRLIEAGLVTHQIDIANPISHAFRQKYAYILGHGWVDDFAFGVVARMNKTFYAQNRSYRSFVMSAVKFCQASIAELRHQQRQIPMAANKLRGELRNTRNHLNSIRKNGLKSRRMRFLEYWNNPSHFGAYKIVDNAVMPDTDPLADLVENLRKGTFNPSEKKKTESKEEKKIKIERFRFSGGRFVSQNGLSMRSYLSELKLNAEEDDNTLHVALFPVMTPSGRPEENLMRAVVNPQPARKLVRLPSIRFVETYSVEFGWQGYHLGELVHTETLFPGEKKIIEIERSTKIAREEVEQSAASDKKARKQSSSLEEKVENEFSDKLLKSDEHLRKQEDRESSAEQEGVFKEQADHREQSNETSSRFSKSFGVTASASAGWGPFSASVSTSHSKSSQRAKRSRDASSSSQRSTDQKTRSFEKASSSNLQSASKENRESFAKNLVNTLKNSAAETSNENSLEIKSSRSEKFEDTSSSKEQVKLENPNIGRTVNYNFFQIQNSYHTVTRLIDIKVVIDNKCEVIQNSQTSDVHVYEIEEIGKIFEKLDTSSSVGTLISAVLMRQIFKNYLTRAEGIGDGNGALAIDEDFDLNQEALHLLNMTSEAILEQENWLEALRNALEYAKKIPFRFQSIDIHSEQPLAVNAGAYYLDSEVGQIAATEEYLERRRLVELDMEKARLEHLRKQTDAQVFQTELPEGLSSLTLGSDTKVLSEASGDDLSSDRDKKDK